MILFKITLAIALVIVIALATLSFMTQQTPPEAAADRQLADCPDRPNCVSSRASRQAQKIDALMIDEARPAQSWQKFIAAVQAAGGEILFDDGRYAHAVFTSGLFRFKDDLQAELADDRIDVRSASRAGRSDFGVNRQRVEKIRQISSRQ